MLWRPGMWWAVHNRMQSPILLLWVLKYLGMNITIHTSDRQGMEPATQPNTRENRSRDLSNSPFQTTGTAGAVCCFPPLSAVKLAANSKAALSPWWVFQAWGTLILLVSTSFPPALSKQFPIVQHFSPLSPLNLSDAAGSEFLWAGKEKAPFLFLNLWA